MVSDFDLVLLLPRWSLIKSTISLVGNVHMWCPNLVCV